MCTITNGIQRRCGIIIRIAQINRTADVDSKQRCIPHFIAIGESQPDQILVFYFSIHVDSNGQRLYITDHDGGQNGDVITC